MLQKLINNLDFKVISTKLASYLPHLLGALILIIVFWIIATIVRKILSSTLRRSKIAKEVQGLLLRVTHYAIVTVAALTIADQLGINITSLLAGVGVAGLALSFAARDTIENIISGVTLIIDQPFKEGDWVAIGDLHATLTEIRLRTTVLTTFDNETIVIPNKSIAQDRIINYTLTPRTRVKILFGIAYKENIDEARKVIFSTIEGDQRILTDPEPRVIVTDLGDSSVNMQLRFWIQNPLDKFSLQFEYTEKCKKALDAAGIEIPFPHLQLFLERSEGLADLTKP
ncbi:mechanosensitive ion channel family protein [Thermodesulfobacteriota bacterium]